MQRHFHLQGLRLAGDTGGAGTVFILGGPGEVKTVSKSDYEQWLADTMGNPAELDIPYQALSEENITSLN